MTTLKHLAIALLLSGTITLPALAEQRGGASSGGWRPQSPAMTMPGDCQSHPCDW
jgi:hypothetical protein